LSRFCCVFVEEEEQQQQVWEEYAGSVRITNVVVGRDREPAYGNGENESGGEL
jgi:hypothetical protein